MFITFEGADGVGKTTQAKKLYNYLKNKGYEVISTREPGGTEKGEKIREILLSPQNKISPWAELFLYAASRVIHTEEVIIPALKANKIVICERFNDATVAYQGYGRGLNQKFIEKINQIASNCLTPELTFLLDRDIKKSFVTKSGKLDRMEEEGIEFQKRVRKGYLDLAKQNPERIYIIKVEEGIEKTFQKIIKIVEKRLINK